VGHTSQVNVEEMRKSGMVKLKGDNMYSVWVKTSCCNLNSAQLVKLADITEKYAKGYLLFTTRQIPIIPFVKLDDVELVKEELNEVYLRLDRCGATVRNINVCYEDSICAEAATNSLSLAEKLENFFDIPMLHKLKIGVAGCKKDCIISRVLNDISFIGAEKCGIKTYDAYVGGRLGVNPFIGIKVAEHLSEEKCINLVRNYFEYLKGEGKQGERGADLINRLGSEQVIQQLTKNLEQITQIEPIKCETSVNGDGSDKTILRIRANCGEVSADQLRQIARIAERYAQSVIHFAVRGSPEIPSIDTNDFESIRKELSEVGLQILDRGIDNLQSCFGDYCTESNVNSQSLLRRIEKLVEEMSLNDLGIKISGAGCPNSCGIAHLNDIGFWGVIEPAIDESICNGCELCIPICSKKNAISIVDGVAVIDQKKCVYCGRCITVCPDAMTEKRRGFAILVGGREGEDTRLGTVIDRFLSEDEAFAVTEGCLRILKEKQTNASMIIDEVGIEKFKQMLEIGS